MTLVLHAGIRGGSWLAQELQAQQVPLRTVLSSIGWPMNPTDLSPKYFWAICPLSFDV